MQVYMGRRRQRGHGIGSVLTGAMTGLARTFLPMVKGLFGNVGSKIVPQVLNTGKTLVSNVGKEMVKTGVNIATDFLHGKNPAMAAKAQIANTGQQIMTNPRQLLQPHPTVPTPAPPPPPPKRKKRKGLKRKTSHKGVRRTQATKRRRPRDIFDK